MEEVMAVVLSQFRSLIGLPSEVSSIELNDNFFWIFKSSSSNHNLLCRDR